MRPIRVNVRNPGPNAAGYARASLQPDLAAPVDMIIEEKSEPVKQSGGASRSGKISASDALAARLQRMQVQQNGGRLFVPGTRQSGYGMTTL